MCNSEKITEGLRETLISNLDMCLTEYETVKVANWLMVDGLNVELGNALIKDSPRSETDVMFNLKNSLLALIHYLSAQTDLAQKKKKKILSASPADITCSDIEEVADLVGGLGSDPTYYNTLTHQIGIHLRQFGEQRAYGN